MMKRQSSIIFALILITTGGLSGCLWDDPQKPATPPIESQEMEQAARDFFDALFEEEYEYAAGIYGGSLDVLANMNPDHDPEDAPGLLAQGCQFNGFTCLRMGEVLSFEKAGEGDFILVVQFLTESGEVFWLGPCCGANETDMPPVSEFTIRVTQDQSGEIKILDLPPYVP